MKRKVHVRTERTAMIAWAETAAITIKDFVCTMKEIKRQTMAEKETQFGKNDKLFDRRRESLLRVYVIISV